MATAGHMRVVDSYELSPTQEGMLFHSLLGEGTGVDLEQIVCSIRGAFDEEAFVAAFHEVAARHAILRTRFDYEAADRPVQEVVEAVEIPVERLDLTGVARSERSSRLDEALRLDRARGIDLARAPCMRLIVVDCGPDEHRVVWTFHHALLDGRSFPLVLREVFGLYGAAAPDRVPPLRSPRPYREYIEFLRGLDLASAESYWRDRLSGFTTPTPLVVDRGATDEQRTSDIQGVFERRLSREQTTALRELAASRDVTVNTLLQSAWAILLHRYSRETEVVFGATRACRHSAFPDADEMVGLFINTLPLRVRLDPEAPLGELLKDVRAQQVELREHEHTPLAKVQGWSDVPRGTPLFETILVYEERALDTVLRTLEVDGARLEFAYHGQTNYPLTLVAYGDDEMLVRLESDRRRLDDAPASRVLDHFVTLLTAMPGHGERKLHELPLLPEGERIALESPGVAAGLGGAGCLHARFEERARSAPDRVAVVCDGESLTYGELDRRANALALRLRSLGVHGGVLVGLRTERSLRVVVGILGILKAGGAYVPFDPAYPRERVEFMLADSGVRVVVTEARFAEDFASCGASLVLLDRESGQAEVGPEAGVGPEDLAYVIYTSGSTGQPKGVLISHRNVGRLFDATEGWFGFGEDDVWSLFHSYAFDFSVWEMWGALLYGGRLVVVPFWVSRSPEAFRELVLREGVTVLNQTPSAFRQFIAADLHAGPPLKTDLRYVIFGGEALELSSLAPWFDRHGDARPRLVNMYGITETTVHVTYRPISTEDLQAGAGSVIGVPIPDLRLFVLDAYRSPVPIGVPGEMYVGGGGVARGYLDRAELTAQRFVPDPFGDGDSRLYRTGDLARRLENGDLEYLGRIDDQVKIRGFRIELGEIEAVLARHPDVSDAVVLAREDAGLDKRLVAYVVAAGQPGALIDELKNHLRAKLPEYMVPAHYVLLAQLPLTPNGKLDRKALPAPEYGRREDERPYVAPRTVTEETLAGIWAAVLGVPRVSVDDNFFELGGDSILAIQVIARCRQAGLLFTPRDLAKRPSVAQLSEVVQYAADTTAAEPEPEPGRGPVAPSPIQRWFFERQFANPHHWNQAFLFEIASDVDLEALQQALDHVVAHHEALRLRVAGQGPRATLSHEPPEAAPAIKRVDLTSVAAHEHGRSIETAAAAAQSQLDLHRGPLLAAVHFGRGAAPGRLLVAIHHLAVDGVSWRLLIEDLEAAYRALRAGSPVQLPPRSASFQRWSEALVDAAAKPELRESSPRWLEIGTVAGNLPASGMRQGADTEGLARTATVSLGVEETQALLQRVPAAYRTQINDVLLTALALALRAWTGRDAHRIDMEGHGREEAIVPLDVSRTVGWFTTLYPVVLDLDGARDDASALKLVKEGLRRVPHRGLSYGLLRYASNDSAVAQQLAAQPTAELLFNYLGQFDQVVAGSELLRFADEATGPWHGPTNERTHRLEVVAAVRNGRFEARWSYGSQREQPEVIGRVADDFIAALRRLIAHCIEPGVSGYTPSDFPLARLEQGALDRLVERYSEIEDVYPLSPMQRLFLSMEAGSARLGFEQWVFRLRGPLDPAALREAWEATLARHAILRTAFVTDAVAEPLQVVNRRAAVPWAEEDWTDRVAADEEGRLESFLRADRERGFDVGVAPLTRVTVIRVADEEHQLVWSTHHLCVDGWSWPLIFRDVGAAYEALREGAEPCLAAPCQYGAYLGWLDAAAPDSRDFWKDALEGFASATPLPLETSPAPEADEGTREASTRLDPATTTALQSLARSLQVTLNTVVQGGWAILLSHLSGHLDVVLGAAFSGRPAELAGIETLVGPCVNNLPVPVQLDPAQTVSEWLPELHERNLEIAQHQYASLSDIQQWAGVPWRLRLFDSLVVFQNYVVDEAVLRWGTVDVEPLTAPEATNYPLTLTVTPGTQMDLKLMGQANRFGPSSLTMMLDGLAESLSRLAERPDASLSEIQSSLPASTKGTAALAVAAAGQRRQSAYVAPASEIERVVADVWEELFEVDHVGVEDNFFDLGGHSILLLQAHARLRERLGKELSVVALLQYPTIRSLARYIGNGETSSAALGAVADRAKLQRLALARQRSRMGKR
ncbi:MAG: amino acid adenylation domain-containing protein [Chloroflexota bacterium]|nr:amino acid adenylation domain-containing protein [Chloroflexota bacterium]